MRRSGVVGGRTEGTRAVLGGALTFSTWPICSVASTPIPLRAAVSGTDMSYRCANAHNVSPGRTRTRMYWREGTARFADGGDDQALAGLEPVDVPQAVGTGDDAHGYPVGRSDGPESLPGLDDVCGVG